MKPKPTYETKMSRKSKEYKFKKNKKQKNNRYKYIHNDL